ncbi:MAG: 5,6-dimethylbenzimidazole synthase [Proteobacteria bacterium]|nr:5,6-dimethylbenzimidazole synthase [Pseudomonadota bacterium]
MEFLTEDRERLDAIFRWRRDVRHFRPDPVPEDMLERLRRAMALAPSVGNARPWRVLRVRNDGLREQIRRIFLACNEAAAEEYDTARQAEYRRLKLAGLDRAPEILAIFTAIDPASGHGLGRRRMPETLTQSTAMAIHTLWLAARAENLGLGMVSILEPAKVEALFMLGAEWRFSALLCLGWPEQHDDTPLLHRAGWQENAATEWEIR